MEQINSLNIFERNGWLEFWIYYSVTMRRRCARKYIYTALVKWLTQCGINCAKRRRRYKSKHRRLSEAFNGIIACPVESHTSDATREKPRWMKNIMIDRGRRGKLNRSTREVCVGTRSLVGIFTVDVVDRYCTPLFLNCGNTQAENGLPYF